MHGERFGTALNMRLSAEISTVPIESSRGSEGPKSAIFFEGVPTGKFIPGAVLEAAVEWRDCWILFLTDTIPFEEMLGVHLLDRRFNILDSAFIGTAYATGTFTSLKLEVPNKLSFRFIGDTEWSIELLGEWAFRIPLVSEPRGVTRKFKFKRAFIVRGQPQPNSA